jgi:hypothetical protein
MDKTLNIRIVDRTTLEMPSRKHCRIATIDTHNCQLNSIPCVLGGGGQALVTCGEPGMSVPHRWLGKREGADGFTHKQDALTPVPLRIAEAEGTKAVHIYLAFPTLWAPTSSPSVFSPQTFS